MASVVEEGFLHITLDSTTNLIELRRGFQSAQEDGRCEEVRISLASRALASTNDDIINNHDAAQDDPDRVFQLKALLQSLLRTKPSIEKIIFDSGFSNDSNTVRLDVIGSVLSQAKALKRFDLSYIHVTCNQEEDISLLQQTLQLSSDANSRATLLQCCLDRCGVVTTNGEELPLDSLLQLFLKAFPNLEWFTICADTFGTLSIETIRNFCQALSLRELMLWNLDLQEDHLVTFFQSLLSFHSPLVRLTIPTTLSKRGAQAVAENLRQPSTLLLQGLTLTVNQLPTQPHNGEQDETVIGEILKQIADGLQSNQSLQSFRLRGSAKITSQNVFARMFVHNYTLHYCSILNAPLDGNSNNQNRSDDAANITMYLQLNRTGRKALLEGAPNHEWVQVMGKLRQDLNCLFYLLQTNPSLCDTKRNW